jgi:hypothetical protein
MCHTHTKYSRAQFRSARARNFHQYIVSDCGDRAFFKRPAAAGENNR